MDKGAEKTSETNEKSTTKGPEMLIEIRKDLYLDCKQNKFLQ